MWWECSECGDQTEEVRAPVQCAACGTAGVLFCPAERDLELDEFRSVWLREGLERARSGSARGPLDTS